MPGVYLYRPLAMTSHVTAPTAAPGPNPVTRVSNGSGAVQVYQIESEMALDLITIPAVSALHQAALAISLFLLKSVAEILMRMH